MEEKRCSCCEEDKQTLRSEEEKKSLINRLKRIEGQIRGLEAMVERDTYCNDILTQSAAVSAALKGFNKQILSGHIRSCVVRDLQAGHEEVIDELLDTLQKLTK